MAIILASQSPRRHDLLERMGITDFRVSAPGIREEQLRGMPPEELVRRLAVQKADAVFAKARPGDIVIAADTVVALEGMALGKPRDRLDAFQTLGMLSGGRHQVHTGVAVYQDDQRLVEQETTTVFFRELDAEEIERYIDSGEPMDKAGSYGIQGLGALFVERIEGDYYNVVGLPVCRLGQMLRRLGVELPPAGLR